MIKLAATDLDGTLLDSKGRLNKEIYDVIEKLKGMGAFFAAASGRQLMSIKKRFEKVDSDVIYIAENGGYVTYRGEELYAQTMDKALVDEILEHIERIKDARIFVCGKKYAYTDSRELKEFMEQPIFGYEMKLVDRLKNIDDDVLKIGLFDTVDPREHSMKELNPIFQDKVHLTLSGYNSLDFLNPIVNKGEAVRRIQEKFGIKKEETVVFGDNFNDIEMFDRARESFAMKNADEYVRSRAKSVIGTNDEDSVVRTLKKIIEEIGR